MDSLVKMVEAGQKLSPQDEALLSELLAGDGGENKASTAIEEGKKAFEETDFDKLSQAQLVSTIMKRIGQEFETQKDYFDSRLTQSSRGAVNAQLKQEIKDAEELYKEEFVDSKDAVLALCERNPALSVEDAFLLNKAKGTREELGKLKKEVDDGNKKKASVSLPDSVGEEALQESLKGKDTAETARIIAAQIGLV